MFDIQIIQVLDWLTTQVQIFIIENQLRKARERLEQLFGDFSRLGKIFKVTDFFVLKATCLTL